MGVALLAPLILVLAVFVAYAQATLAHSQNTGLVGWLTGKLASLPILGGLSAKQVLKLDAWITNMLGRHFKQIEARGVAWLSALDSFTRRNAKAALSLGAPVWALAYWLTHVEIGRQAKAHDAPIARKATRGLAQANQALRIAESVAHAKPGTNVNVRVTRVEKVTLPHAEEWTWINEHWGGLKKAVSMAAAGVLAPTLPRVKPLSWPAGLTPAAIRRRLHRVEGLLGVTGMAIAMAGVLRVTPRCLTNGNIGRTARRLCGMPAHWLDDLLGLVADFFVLENICLVLPWLEAAVSEVATPLVVGLTEAGAGVCHSKDVPAAAMPVPQLYLPANVVSLTAGV